MRMLLSTPVCVRECADTEVVSKTPKSDVMSTWSFFLVLRGARTWSLLMGVPQPEAGQRASLSE